ncbi:MAG: YciI family protein [Bacteroidota bacterium]|nr:YciI family protein [Bacteroidota bacterium]MDP4236130.1 YciI family protein [Bacteroidota bacterium]
MLLIRNDGDAKAGMSTERHEQFLHACMVFIDKLKKNGNLISAQPLIREGKMVSGTPGAFKEGPYNETKEIIVGYYHILAKDLDEAVAIAQGNPEFAYSSTAKIEVRPIKMMEETTSYEYPKGKP